MTEPFKAGKQQLVIIAEVVERVIWTNQSGDVQELTVPKRRYTAQSNAGNIEQCGQILAGEQTGARYYAPIRKAESNGVHGASPQFERYERHTAEAEFARNDRARYDFAVHPHKRGLAVRHCGTWQAGC